MRPRHLPILLLLLAAPAGAQADLVDQFFVRFLHPRAAAGPDALHLLYIARVEQRDKSESHYYRYTPDGGWVARDVFDGHEDVALLDGGLYVFRQANFSVYNDQDWTTSPWTLQWPPAAACRVGDEVWVFGSRTAAGKHRVHGARLARVTDGGPAAGPSEFGGLDLPRGPSDLCAVATGDRSAMVFWHHDVDEQETNEVWHATLAFDGEPKQHVWGAPRRIDVPYAPSDFTAVLHDGAIRLFTKERYKRISAKRPLQAQALADDGRWSPPEPVPGALDPSLDLTIDIEAASFQGTLYVFRVYKQRVVADRWRAGQWLEPHTIIDVPAWATYVVWWILANVGGCLILLPPVAWCALRSRGQQRQAVLPDGRTFLLATWSRRAAALLLDFLVTQLLWFAVTALFGLGQVQANAQLADVPPVVALQFGVFFAYFALSEALACQTMGKRLLNIAVISRAGARPQLGNILIRNLLRPWLPLVPLAYVVGSLVLLLTPAHQRVGDLLAGTIVIELPRPRRTHSDS